MRWSLLLLFAVTSLGAGGCHSDARSAAAAAAPGAAAQGRPVAPPFAVHGDARGLLLVWFDEEGAHTAADRDEIPQEHRGQVRVDSLRLPPEQRLDPDFVYLADLRAEVEGRYPVRKVRRAVFDALLDRAAGVAPVAEDDGQDVEAAGDGSGGGGSADGHVATADPEVIIYGASWCGACRQAASFFRAQHIHFVEKDIERDPAALSEMQAKARRAGMSPSGIPVIDFRGTLLQGFDQRRLQALITAG